MNYYMTELHAHTRHSDGNFSTQELLNEANAFGYDVLAITDHNTMAPVDEVPTLDTQNLLVLPGMEWTTFFGHLLVIGANRVVDWRKATVDTIDESLREVKAAGGIAGIAHPFSIGSPICTGCHWDFHIEDYHLVDFIEVWNRLNPDDDFRSQQAYELWIDLLNQGYRISCSAGRDWHRMEEATDNTALTYVGAENESEESILTSLKVGNFYITLGVKMTIFLQKGQEIYHMGQEVTEGEAQLKLTAFPTEQAKLKTFGFEVTHAVIWLNDRILGCEVIQEGKEITIPVELEKGYIRVELFGKGKGKTEKRLAISNPFYIS